VSRGSAVVEFALVFPLAVIVLLVVVEVGVIGRAQIELVAAAREGARHAAVDPDPARAAHAVKAALGRQGDRARVSVTRPQAVGAPAEVTVLLPHVVASPVFGGFTLDLTARAVMRVER
jgi:hypothetical protein